MGADSQERLINFTASCTDHFCINTIFGNFAGLRRSTKTFQISSWWFRVLAFWQNKDGAFWKKPRSSDRHHESSRALVKLSLVRGNVSQVGRPQSLRTPSMSAISLTVNDARNDFKLERLSPELFWLSWSGSVTCKWNQEINLDTVSAKTEKCAYWNAVFFFATRQNSRGYSCPTDNWLKRCST